MVCAGTLAAPTRRQPADQENEDALHLAAEIGVAGVSTALRVHERQGEVLGADGDARPSRALLSKRRSEAFCPPRDMSAAERGLTVVDVDDGEVAHPVADSAEGGASASRPIAQRT